MRAFWTGSIGFGLVNIPVRLYTASEDSSLSFDMLDSHDMSHIRYKKVNENTGKEVKLEDIVKAYKTEEGYVPVEKEDFEAAAAEKSKIINVENFVNEEEIHSIYYESPYYLEPDKGGAKAYGILRDALAASGKVGVGTFVLRNKESLAVVKPYKDVLMLQRIKFDQEIRETKDLNVPEVHKSKTKEIDLALQLIDQLTEKFDIAKYRDTYSDKLLEVIEMKAKGKKPKAKKMKVVHKKSEDLVAMLKASLENRQQKRAS